MPNFKISTSDVRPDPDNPNWTRPRSYGVWELPETKGGKRYRYGNYPIRGKELVRDLGAARLIALYTSRVAAKSYADSLN